MSNFARFWRAYPKRWKIKDARKIWEEQGIEKDEALVERILASITEFRKSDQWKKEGGVFIPLPANFLRDERWEDELKIDIEEDTKRW